MFLRSIQDSKRRRRRTKILLISRWLVKRTQIYLFVPIVRCLWSMTILSYSWRRSTSAIDVSCMLIILTPSSEIREFASICNRILQIKRWRKSLITLRSKARTISSLSMAQGRAKISSNCSKYGIIQDSSGSSWSKSTVSFWPTWAISTNFLLMISIILTWKNY